MEILNWLQQLGQWSLHPNSSCLLCIRHVCEDLFVHGERVLRAEALNMRLTEYVNTKWEEMIRDWRAVMYAKTEHDYAVAWSNFKPGNQGSFVNISMNHDIWLSRHKSSSVHSYQHSVENERTLTQHRHRGMLFASVNGFISQFALDKVQEHMALFNLTARSSLPVLFGSLWDCLVPTSSRKDCGRVRASPLTISMPTGISDV